MRANKGKGASKVDISLGLIILILIISFFLIRANLLLGEEG